MAGPDCYLYGGTTIQCKLLSISSPNSGLRVLCWQLEIGHGGHWQTLEIRVSTSCKTFISIPRDRPHCINIMIMHVHPPAHRLLWGLIEFQNRERRSFCLAVYYLSVAMKKNDDLNLGRISKSKFKSL